MNTMLHTSEVDLITREVTVKDFLNVNKKEITRNNSFKNVGNIKELKDFPHYYVSDQGKIYSDMKGKTRELKAFNDGRGYLSVGLYKDGKTYTKRVHRLVLETFQPISDMQNYEVNHISEIKTDNRLCNLNWMTRKENCNWGTRNERMSKAKKGKKFSPSHREAISKALKGHIAPNRKKVLQYDQKYNLITSYESRLEAAKAFGTSDSTISRYCRNLKLFRNSFYLQYENS